MADDDAEMDVEGHNGQVHFDGETVTITRHGVIAHLSGGEPKVIPVSEIASVQLEGPHGMLNGFIHFQRVDGEHADLTATQAAPDPDSVVFTHHEQPDFEALRDAVLAAIGS